MIDKILMAARKLADTDHRRVDRVLHVDAFEPYAELVRLVNDYFNPGRAAGGGLCKKCGAPLLWVKTPNGANAPLDPVMIAGLDADGVAHRIYLNHFSTCPKADEVRREKNAAGTEPEDGKSKAAGP